MRMHLRNKRLASAEALVEEVLAKGIQPDVDFYGSLVDYYAQRKMLRSAYQVRQVLNISIYLYLSIYILYDVYPHVSLDDCSDNSHALASRGNGQARVNIARKVRIPFASIGSKVPYLHGTTE
jgi:hypothetical protein